MDDIVNMARKVDESKVNLDLNNDGDMDDIILNKEINEKFAPGRPWWGGKMISKKIQKKCNFDTSIRFYFA